MPFNRFKAPDGRNVDTVLGPEMKSTGEVMGFDADFGTAFAKAQAGAFGPLPTEGRVFVSMANRDKRHMVFPIKVLAEHGFEIMATQGTAEVLRRNGVQATVVRKHFEGEGPNGEKTTVQLILDGEIQLVINTPNGSGSGAYARVDGYEIRTAAIMANIPCITTVQGLGAAVQGMEAMRRGDIGVRSLQDWATPVTLYRLAFDHLLTRTDPEKAHHAGFRAIRAARPLTGAASRRLPADPVEAMGILFPNRLGLAAGFDKNAVGIDGLAALGFGHVEIGTVTGEPQPGNPTPRLFRLPADRAVVNRMGFNNDGAEVVARRLAARAAARGVRPGPVLGVNIGKTKVVPEEEAVGDYEKSAGLLAPYADYLVVNVSSPNTPGLRDLQAVEKLEPLLRAVRRRADEVTTDRVPLLVKIAPDLSDDDVLAVADLATGLGLDGIIATNTTISRAGLATPAAEVEAIGAGGLSGRPLTERSLEVLRLLKGRVGDRLTLVGVGGITTCDDACARIDAGATLVQGYTAFVYEGPLWPARIVRGLASSGKPS